MRFVLPLALLLTLLLAPPPAAAQTPWSPWSTSVALPDPPTPRLQEPSPTALQRTTRIALELLGASVGAGVSLGAGFGLGCALDGGRCDAALSATLAVGVFGVPAGVSLAGSLAGARGGYGWSVLGQLAGVVVAIPLALLLERSEGFAAAALIVLPVAGAIVGFEVSSDNAPTPRARATGMRWAPALSVTVDGAMAGAAGVF